MTLTYVKEPVHRCPVCSGMVMWFEDDERGQCINCGEDVEQNPRLAKETT